MDDNGYDPDDSADHLLGVLQIQAVDCDSIDDSANEVLALLRPHRPAVGGDDDPDDGVHFLLEQAAKARRPHFKRRSSLLTYHMRTVKRALKRRRTGQVAPHVLHHIRMHNAVHAVRTSDFIDVNEKKPKRVKGKGKYKCWLRPAILRVCWGKRPKAELVCRRRRRGKQNPNAVTAPTAASSSTYGSFYDASVGYIQQTRNAVAERYLQLETAAFRNLRFADLQILEVQLDETEVPTRIDFPGETNHMLVVHMVISRFRGDNKLQLQFVLPPAMVASTSANHLLAALKQRLPFSIPQMLTTARRTCLVLNVDSAGSCLKLGRGLGSLCPTIAAPCRLHQLCICLVFVLRAAGLPSAVFCASILLHRRRVQARLRKALRKHIHDHLDLRFRPPDPIHIEQVHT